MSPVTDDVRRKVEQALDERRFPEVRRLLVHREPADLAEYLQELDSARRAVIFRVLPREVAADVFEYLEPDVQEELLRELTQDRLAAILEEMSPDDRTALLEELPAPVVRQLLNLLPFDEREIAVRLLGYPEKSIGRLMTPEYVAVRPDWTVRQALEHIRKYGKDSETLSVIYVVDERGKLLDDLRIRKLLLADPETKIRDLCDGHYVSLKATDDQETAVAVFKEYDRQALPVTDSQGNLLGIVTMDDVLDVAEEEATEDIQKIGGMEALDDPYLESPFTERIRKRAGWLILLFLGQMLTANAMGYFQDEISQALILVLFLPLIVSSGGNTGSQGATLVIRAMALGEVTLRDWWRVLRRELASGLTLGLILGLIGFFRIALGQYLTGAYGPHWVEVALTVSLALVGVVLWGNVVGSMLPFVLRALGADPATSSNPFVATLVDVTGLVIYFSIASLVLKGSLL